MNPIKIKENICCSIRRGFNLENLLKENRISLEDLFSLMENDNDFKSRLFNRYPALKGDNPVLYNRTYEAFIRAKAKELKLKSNKNKTIKQLEKELAISE